MTDYISQTETNKLIRKALRESFPGVKFSVRTRGGSTNINWTNGPNAKQIDSLVSAFEGSYFDGMIDYKGSRYAMLDGREVHFLADFIFTNRHYSDDLEHMMAARLIAEYGQQCEYLETATPESFIADWHQGNLYNVFPCGGDWSNENALGTMLHQKLYKYTLSPFPQHSQTLDRVRFSGDDGYGAGTVGRDGKGEGYGGYPRSERVQS